MSRKKLKDSLGVPKQVWVRLDSAATDKLDRYVKHLGQTRSRLMRDIIQTWLDGQTDSPQGEPAGGGRIYDQSTYMRQRFEQRRAEEALLAAARAQREVEELRKRLP